MFNSINRTIFDIPLTWDRTRFESSRVKCRQARKLIEASVNAQYNKQLKDLFFQKLDVENTIVESQQRLLNQEKKMRALENLTEVASQSLDDYFDKRMEHVRTAIQEHCDAIRQILREENDHWQEIHTAIDQNLITKEDLHPPKPVEEETPLANIHTIDEVDEEEQTSKLLNNKTVTPLLTQMIRKSRMLSMRPSANVSTEALVRSKEEQMSVMLPLTSARRTLTVIDTTFVVKHEQSQATEPDESYQAEVEVQPAAPSPATNIIPIQSAPMTTVTPLESVPTPEAETTSSYSQPKPPARLYFSPTLLLDDDETGPIQPVLSTVDQNKTNNDKPKAATRRFGQTFLLDNVKTEEVDESQDAENIRPKISDEIPFLFQADPTMLMDKPSMIEPNSELVEVVELQKSIVYTKRRTNALVEPKVEPEPIHMTRRATRQRKQVVEPEAVARPTRKRKQSVSDHDDGTEDNVALRKKKPGRQPAKSTTRKPRAKKVKEIPIRELSPLPIVDRSKHYSTRFSTHSHRFNNLTLSTTAATLHDDGDDDNDHIKTKSKRSLVKSRAKSTRRTRHHDNDEPTLPAVGSTNKKQPKTRAKLGITTRTRKK